ncbi:5620_t:CDS:2 [Racocetra fulgida]|uniref:5620_t:CDS:1 n=1 Tax=Racocetra fulgida TaxID=60492 RepID=A0A9N9F286_9GLOM|nr:5620_t:CDS:2 [Racocetra fulgida]
MPSHNPNNDHSDDESSDYFDTDDDIVEPGAKKKKTQLLRFLIMTNAEEIKTKLGKYTEQLEQQLEP